MKITNQNLRTFLPLLALSFAGLANAADLTRAVKVTEGTEIHEYLGNQFGQTLYTFDLDKNGTSQCNGACAEKWPAFVLSAEEAAALVAPFASVKRASGLLQLTYETKPVYTYYLDRVEGDDMGDGVGDVWHDIDFK